MGIRATADMLREMSLICNRCGEKVVRLVEVLELPRPTLPGEFDIVPREVQWCNRCMNPAPMRIDRVVGRDTAK
jgi:thymidine kinase